MNVGKFPYRLRRNVVQQIYAKNIMDKKCDKQGSLKEARKKFLFTI